MVRAFSVSELQCVERIARRKSVESLARCPSPATFLDEWSRRYRADFPRRIAAESRVISGEDEEDPPG